MEAMTPLIRVRPLLSAMNAVEKRTLKKLLPTNPKLTVPEEPAGVKYPSALLSQLALIRQSNTVAPRGC